MYDIVVKSGKVVDPSQGIYEEMDVGISGNRIQDVEHRISDGNAREVLDATGKIVTAGFVDLHAHAAVDIVRLGVDPDSSCLLKGTTCAVDAGSTGELLFHAFRKYVIEKATARVFAFLNIESLGMIEYLELPPDNTDQRWAKLLTAIDELYVPFFINVDRTLQVIKENVDVVVGIKWAHHGIKGMGYAREVCDRAGCVLMIENLFMPQALKYVKKGDIVTHIYHNYPNPTTNERDGMLSVEGKVLPEFFEAVKQGVILDLGHGKGSFSWKVCEVAMREGLPPTTISTDLWSANLAGPVYDLPTTMSKLLHLGMSLEEVIKASTWTPAVAIKRGEELGTLRPGAFADLTISKIAEGKFPLQDCYGEARMGSRRFDPTDVVSNGKIVLKRRESVVYS